MIPHPAAKGKKTAEKFEIYSTATCTRRPPCGIIPNMKAKVPVSKAAHRTKSAPSLSAHDLDLTIKTVRGIADIAAGRFAPVATVRARVLSRYADKRALA